MLLSDKSIKRALNDNEIRVRPDHRPEQIQPASFDVRLGEKIYDVESDTYITAITGTINLEPGKAYIGHTMDHVSLPNHIAAQLTGRSSVGRRGIIIHKTAGWIDPGFRGEITLELYNFSDEVQTFEVGDRIGQLVFFKLDQSSDGYDGQYQDQTGPTHA